MSTRGYLRRVIGNVNLLKIVNLLEIKVNVINYLALRITTHDTFVHDWPEAPLLFG